MTPVRQTYPRYFTYDERPVAFVESPGGGLYSVAADPYTGGFVRAMRYLADIDFDHDADIEQLAYEDFVPAVEAYRARNRLGEGALQPLYEIMDGLERTAEQERRPLTDDEAALLRSLSKRTHPLFEEYLARQGHAGTPPPPVPAALRIARVFDSVDGGGTPRYDRRLVGFASADRFQIPEVDEETRAEAVATIGRPAGPA